MSSTPPENIIEQLRKVKRLADNAGTEGEAAAAAAAMARLLSKYNLEISEIDLNAEASETVEENIFGHKNSSQWRTLLMHYVAKYNFCTTLTSTRYITVNGRLENARCSILIGQKHNREVAEFLFRTLEAAVERLANEHGYARASMRRGVGRSSLSPRKSFITGAVRTIGERLAVEWQQFQAPEGVKNDKALVLVDKNRNALATYLVVHYPKLGKGPKQRDVNAAAYAHGRQAGHEVGIHRGVAGGGASGALGSGR